MSPFSTAPRGARQKNGSRRGLWRLAATALLSAVSFAGAVNTARFAVTDSGTPIPQNSTGNQTLTLTNMGPDTGTNVVATYTPPTTAGITVNSVTASPGGTCTLAGGVYTCPPVPSVALSGTVTLTVNLTVASSVAVGTSAGSTVKVDSAEFNPGSGTGESLFNIWGTRDVSAAAGDAFWFAYDGNYNNTGAKVEPLGSDTTTDPSVAAAWSATQANPPGAYSIKADDGTLPFNDVASYAPYPATAGTPGPKYQNIETTAPSLTVREVVVNNSATYQKRNNRRAWEIRTGIYLTQPGPLFVCVPQPDDGMYVAVDGTVVAEARRYNSGVVNSSGATYAAGYHEIVYRIVNRNNQQGSYEGGTGGFGVLGMGTSAATSGQTGACSGPNYNAFTRIAPSSNVTVSDPAADLAVNKTGTASAVVGGAVSYTIKVWNRGPSSVTGAALTDAVPGNLTNVTWTCAASGTASCGAVTSGSGNNISLTTGTLPVNTSVAAPTGGSFLTLTVTGTASSAGSFANTASVAVPTGVSEVNASDNKSSANTTLTNALLPCTTNFYALLGSGGTYTTVAALSPTGTQGTTVATVPSGTNNAALAVSPDGSRLFVGTSDGLLQVFDVVSGTWVASVTIPGNTRTLRATVTRPTAANPNGVGYLSVGTSLYSFQTTSPYTVSAATTITYTETSGLTNPVPTVSGSGDFFADASGNLYLSVNNAASYLDTFRIDPATGVATFITRINDANIGTDTYGGYAALNGKVYASSSTGRIIEVDLGNAAVSQTSAANSANASTDLASCSYPNFVFPDAVVTKTGPQYARPATDVTYTVSAVNSSSAALSGVVLTDTLPANTTYVASSGGGVYDGTARTVTWTVGTLAASTTQSYTLTLTTPNAAAVTGGTASVTNTATISSTNEIYPNRGNNGASAQTRLVYAALTKQVRNVTADLRDNGGVARFGTVADGRPGDVLEYCVAFSNPGGADLPNFMVSDDVPGNTSALTTGYDAEEPGTATGFGVRLTRGGTPFYLTSAADTDAGSLSTSGGRFSSGVLGVTLSKLAAGETGSVCFRASIR